MFKLIGRLCKPNILIYAFLISAITVVYSLFSFPIFFQMTINNADSAAILLALLSGVIVYTVVLVLLSHLFIQVKILLRPNEIVPKTLQYAKGLFLLSILAIAAVFVISLIYGIISVLIYKLCEQSLPIDQIKTVINLITSVLTLLIMPVFLNIFAVFALDKHTVKASIVIGLRPLKKPYLISMSTLCLLFFSGYLIVALTDLLTSEITVYIIKIISFSVIGMGIILASFAVYQRRK